MASVEEVHPAVTTWLYPRNPKRMEISLESVPMVPLGIQKMLTCFTCPECHRRYCSSENSCAPPPVPSITPISRFSSIDIPEGSIPASWSASLEAAIAKGTTRETCLRSRASTHASSSNSGISPAMLTGRWEGSKREIRFTPDFPASTARQNASFPKPLGLTTPNPVMTTRGGIFRKQDSYSDAHCKLKVTSNGIIVLDAVGPLHISAVLPH